MRLYTLEEINNIKIECKIHNKNFSIRPLTTLLVCDECSWHSSHSNFIEFGKNFDKGKLTFNGYYISRVLFCGDDVRLFYWNGNIRLYNYSFDSIVDLHFRFKDDFIINDYYNTCEKLISKLKTLAIFK